MKIILAILILAVASTSYADFTHTNPSDARVTTGQIGTIIVDKDAGTIKVNFREGYINSQTGKFVNLGTNHVTLVNTVAKPARPLPGVNYSADGQAHADYDATLTAVKSFGSNTFWADGETYLQTMIATLRGRGEKI